MPMHQYLQYRDYSGVIKNADIAVLGIGKWRSCRIRRITASCSGLITASAALILWINHTDVKEYENERSDCCRIISAPHAPIYTLQATSTSEHLSLITGNINILTTFKHHAQTHGFDYCCSSTWKAGIDLSIFRQEQIWLPVVIRIGSDFHDRSLVVYNWSMIDHNHMRALLSQQHLLACTPRQDISQKGCQNGDSWESRVRVLGPTYQVTTVQLPPVISYWFNIYFWK